MVSNSSTPVNCGYLVIGGGIAGVSVAAELAAAGESTILLEQEDQLAYHTTGRSAAIFLETYGSRIFRLFTHYSREFYLNSLGDDPPLITPRGAIFVARESGLTKLRSLYDEVAQLTDSVRWLSAEDLQQEFPALREDWVAGALEPDAKDIDVHALHQSYVRRFRRSGGHILCDSPVSALRREGDAWVVQTPQRVYRARTLVNCAGAWADEVAGLAGLSPLGIRPLKRTAILARVDLEMAEWPYIGDVEESFYFKPSKQGLLISPCDETPEPASDVTADEMDVAIAADRFETALRGKVVSVQARWAGLRSFAPDRNPVIGFDPRCEGFFWLAGQGGYGIQTAPAIAELASALLRQARLPAFMDRNEIDLEEISPTRLCGANSTKELCDVS
ncbi:FAD-dependent oxidoreductase [Thioclava litoralis]|uniref:FAD-dependent oxidoreductase n=1 Tax=Thioclava litoralis TaxID=3076557 RepID=A0ABZ1E1N9_9RHOB|nr:FAD-dependent oxidoreductase [Thioclava sp. FTW29]